MNLAIVKSLVDKAAQGRACGNLGNTLKVLGKFDEAIVCCQRHLDISRELGDKVMTKRYFNCSRDSLSSSQKLLYLVE